MPLADAAGKLPRRSDLPTSAPLTGSQTTRRLEAVDARADDGRRVVLVSAGQVVIARGVQGVFMRIALSPRDYQGVALRLLDLDADGFLFEIQLAHADADLGVALARCRDQAEAEIAWRQWARFLALPMLVERTRGVYESPGPIAVKAQPRQRGGALRSRRARFLTRRKVGRPELCVSVGAIRELTGGSR
jgi:hypothetical protein